MITTHRLSIKIQNHGQFVSLLVGIGRFSEPDGMTGVVASCHRLPFGCQHSYQDLASLLALTRAPTAYPSRACAGFFVFKSLQKTQAPCLRWYPRRYPRNVRESATTARRGSARLVRTNRQLNAPNCHQKKAHRLLADVSAGHHGLSWLSPRRKPQIEKHSERAATASLTEGCKYCLLLALCAKRLSFQRA